MLIYRGGNKGLFVLLSRTQAGPGRTVKQEQEEMSRNHVQTIISPSVCTHAATTFYGKPEGNFLARYSHLLQAYQPMKFSFGGDFLVERNEWKIISDRTRKHKEVEIIWDCKDKLWHYTLLALLFLRPLLCHFSKISTVRRTVQPTSRPLPVNFL